MNFFVIIKSGRSFLLLLSLLICQNTLADSENTYPLDISLGSIKTEAEQAALGILVKYSENIDSNYLLLNAKPKNFDIDSDDSGWLFDISPEIEIQTGDADAFNGIIAKITGNYIRFDLKKIEYEGQKPVITPDSSKLFHVYPISVGFESDRNFQNVSGLLEAGYIPFYSKWKLGLQHKVGIFIQGGYKFENDEDDNATPNIGGAVNESEEKPGDEIARIKFDAGTDLTLPFLSKGKYNIHFIPRARLWYDLINSEVYHKYEAVLKLTLGKDRSFDLRYEDGSGAPNFNEGEQFSANISFKY